MATFSKNFSKDDMKTLRILMQEALDKAGISGIDISVGNISFTSDSATVKVEVKRHTADGISAVLKQAMVLNNITKTVSKDGRTTLVDYHSRKYKTPFIIERGGKRFKIDRETAFMYFNY